MKAQKPGHIKKMNRGAAVSNIITIIKMVACQEDHYNFSISSELQKKASNSKINLPTLPMIKLLFLGMVDRSPPCNFYYYFYNYLLIIGHKLGV